MYDYLVVGSGLYGRAGYSTGDGLRQAFRGFFRTVGNIMSLREIQSTCRLIFTR